MKKLLAIALILILCTSCGANVSDKTASDLSAEDVMEQTEEEIQEEPEVNTPIPQETEESIMSKLLETYTEEEIKILKEIEGSYFYDKYLESYKITKSAFESEEPVRIIVVTERDGKYTCMEGDAHQGFEPFVIDKIENSGGKYIISSGMPEDKRHFKGIYTSGSDIMEVSIKEPYYYDLTGEMKSYSVKRYDSMWGENTEMSKILFESVPGVEIREDGAYGKIKGTVYRMLPICEPYDDFPEIDLPESDGFMFLYKEGEPLDGKSKMVEYRYDNGAVTIADEDGIMAVFDK